MTADAMPLRPAVDPLIAEAKHRARRRRVLVALVLLAGAGVLTFILRPSPAPISVAFHGSTETALSHVQVPVDKHELHWEAGIKSVTDHPLSPRGVARLKSTAVTAVDNTGATVLRGSVWPRAGAVEVVLATNMIPAEYLVQEGRSLVDAFGNRNLFVKIVDAKGSQIIEWYHLPKEGMVGYARGLEGCGPMYVGGASNPPPCPAK